MLSTEHKIAISDARDLSFIDDQSVDIVVTSPPYPMIEMWDELFGMLNPEIAPALERDESRVAFELMHKELDRVWSGLLRVLTRKSTPTRPVSAPRPPARPFRWKKPRGDV